MYKILGADGKEYGPVSADVVREWITTRRADSQTMIQPEGSSDWKYLSDLREFADELGSVAPPSPLSAAPLASHAVAAVASAPPNSSLAIASLVLGILSVTCLGIVTGIPAIITGHMARGRARKSPPVHGGAGLALAGLILGYVGIALTVVILAARLLPALTHATGKAESIHCSNNLKQIALAALIYANDHEGVFPADYAAMTNELPSKDVLICPGDEARSKLKSGTNPPSDPRYITYDYLAPGIKDTEAAQREIFRCPIHGNVAMGDGSVRRSPR